MPSFAIEFEVESFACVKEVSMTLLIIEP